LNLCFNLRISYLQTALCIVFGQLTIMPSDAKKKRDQKKKEAAKKYDIKKPVAKDGDEAVKANDNGETANCNGEITKNGNELSGMH
jgi:hypothetical protein